MTDKTWIDEYIKLLFPINASDINISNAQRLKKEHTPSKLYKYRTFNEYSIDALKKSALFMSKAAELNDPFECAVSIVSDEYFFESLRRGICKTYQEKQIFNETEIKFLLSATRHDFFDFIESRSDLFKVKKGLLEEFTNRIIKDNQSSINRKASQTNLNNILICALSETNDNPVMWSHYSNEHKGFCIEYNFANFTPAPHQSWYMLNPIIYKDIIPDFSQYYFNHNNFNNLIATYAAMIKAKGWEYEEEWRLILPWGEVDGKGMLINAPKPTAIYVGCRASESDISSLKEIVKCEEIPVYQMKRQENSFLLYPEIIDN